MEKPTKIVFNIWTYKNDEEKVFWCVKSIQKFLSPYIAGIYIWDDGLNPMSLKNTERLRKIGCIVNQTFYKRNGNLIGQECILGMIENYIQAVRETNADFFAKIDPDVLVISKNLSQFLKDYPAIFAQTKEGYFYGNLYIISKQSLTFLKTLIEHPEKLQEIPKHRNFSKDPIDTRVYLAYEDYFFGIAAKRVFKDAIKKYYFREYWVHPFPPFWDMMKDLAQTNLVCNFGVLHSPHEETAEKMKAMLRYLA